MLVLSRRESERILFPQLGITVEVVKVSGHMAKIGIEAPRSVRVLREEVANDSEADASAVTGGFSPGVELGNCLVRFTTQLEKMLERCDPETGDRIESILDEIEYRIQELAPGSFVAESEPGYRVIAPDRISSVNLNSPSKQTSDPIRNRAPFVTNGSCLPC